MYRHPFLSDAKREAIETAHFDLDDREIARYWTLSDQDRLRIDRRRDSNRFGFAVQLCLLRLPGWPPQRRDRVPLPAPVLRRRAVANPDRQTHQERASARDHR